MLNLIKSPRLVMGSCPDSCVRGLAKTSRERAVFLKKLVSCGPIALERWRFPLTYLRSSHPKSYFSEFRLERSNWRPEIRLRSQVSGRMADSCKKKKPIFGFKTIRIRWQRRIFFPHPWHLRLISRAVLAWLLATLPYGELARRLKRRGIFSPPPPSPLCTCRRGLAFARVETN